jgi:hypothetical protein
MERGPLNRLESVAAVALGTRNVPMTVRTNAFVMSATIFKYDESVIFSISRVGCLRWQYSSWACAHGKARGEKHSDYCEERRAQCGEGHKKSRAHRGLRVHALIEFKHL